jgi:hypothetical protein
MKYFISICNIVICAIVLVTCSIGLAVHRADSISVAYEIIQRQNIADKDREAIEHLVSSTGNTSSYHTLIANAAMIGILLNLVAIPYWVFAGRKPTRQAAQLTAKA